MTTRIFNIDEARWSEQEGSDGGLWRYKDLSGDHLGVRVEDIVPGGNTSVHHFHTMEEEHVLILEGSATLILGADEHSLKQGDHVWFAAGAEDAHHIENRTSASCKLLVFGERNDGDVVVYPERGVMLIKALAWQRFKYEPR